MCNCRIIWDAERRNHELELLGVGGETPWEFREVDSLFGSRRMLDHHFAESRATRRDVNHQFSVAVLCREVRRSLRIS